MITVEHEFDHSIITILDNEGKTDDVEIIVDEEKLFEEVVLNHKEKIDIIYHTQIIDNIESQYHPNIIRSHIPLINYMMEGFIKGIDSKQKEEEGKIYDFKEDKYVTKMITYHENIYQNKMNIISWFF